MTKRLLLLFLPLLAYSSPAYALQSVETSVYAASFTATAEGPAYISSTVPGATFHSVVVGSPSTGGTVTVFDGQGLGASKKIAVIYENVVGTYLFDVAVTSGLSYTTAGNANGTTITFRRNLLP